MLEQFLIALLLIEVYYLSVVVIKYYVYVVFVSGTHTFSPPLLLCCN